MKSFLIFFLLSLTVQLVSAQPSQAEIDKMTKQAQELGKKYGTDTARARSLKGLHEPAKPGYRGHEKSARQYNGRYKLIVQFGTWILW